MSQQRPVSNELQETNDLEEPIFEDESEQEMAQSTIRKKESINPAKRRRLEAMREERELMKDIKDVFDDWDD